MLVAPIDGIYLGESPTPVVPVRLEPGVDPATLAAKSTIVLGSDHPVETVDHTVDRCHPQLGRLWVNSVGGFVEIVVGYAPEAHRGYGSADDPGTWRKWSPCGSWVPFGGNATPASVCRLKHLTHRRRPPPGLPVGGGNPFPVELICDGLQGVTCQALAADPLNHLGR